MRRVQLVFGCCLCFCALGLSAQKADTNPPPTEPVIYKPGGEVIAPKLEYSVDPEFSDEARKHKYGGTVTISLVVDARGTPQDVKVAHSMAESAKPKDRRAARSLDEKAVAAVKQYRFSPGTLRGKAVPVALSVTVNFQLF